MTAAASRKSVHIWAIAADMYAATGVSETARMVEDGVVLLPDEAVLHALWSGRRGSKQRPDRLDIDVLELRPWLGRLLMIQYDDPITDNGVYLVYGDTVAAAAGTDLTGRRLSELPDTVRDVMVDAYAAVRRSSRPTLSILNVAGAEVTYPVWRRLILPLGPDGSDRLLVLVTPVPHD